MIPPPPEQLAKLEPAPEVCTQCADDFEEAEDEDDRPPPPQPPATIYCFVCDDTFNDECAKCWLYWHAQSHYDLENARETQEAIGGVLLEMLPGVYYVAVIPAGWDGKGLYGRSDVYLEALEDYDWDETKLDPDRREELMAQLVDAEALSRQVRLVTDVLEALNLTDYDGIRHLAQGNAPLHTRLREWLTSATDLAEALLASKAKGN